MIAFGLGCQILFIFILVGFGISNSYILFGSLTSHNRYFVVSELLRPRVTLESIYWPCLLSIIVSIISSYLPTRIAAAKTTTETLRFS